MLFSYYKKYYYFYRALLILLIITIVSHLFRDHLDIINISLIHLIPVLVVAIHGNIKSTILITIVSLILFNFLYIPPLYSFNVHNNLYIWSFLIFAIVGWIITVQAKNLHTQTKENEMRENLLNIVSHDLRTPLSTIHGSINLLLSNDNLNKETIRNLLLDVNYASIRMKRLISNLLDSARLKSGANLNFDWCDFEDITGVALEDFSEKQCNEFLNLDIDDNLELFWGDNALLVQLMINLIDNAFKYSKNGKKIDLRIVDYDQYIKIIVYNESNYIDKKKLENIFDKFYRLEDTNDISGSGIGLSICKSIVNLHNGGIKAVYENNGISIEIILPKSKKVHIE